MKLLDFSFSSTKYHDDSDQSGTQKKRTYERPGDLGDSCKSKSELTSLTDIGNLRAFIRRIKKPVEAG